MTDISIVSGTYNRLNSVQQMVASIRQSFANIYGLSYEIVLVDGGSDDGTIDWCKSQSDIRLIEHGKLLGAVKAFNDGAFASNGKYVVLGNDDIEYVGESILTAYIYMQSHSDCGIGCFYQDRNGRSWHVEEMPCQENNQQVHRPYGQVCIVPKWLGDYVGWWGDYLHTYGGDNELSSRVYELGFKVSPVPNARIHDREVADDLRKINNISGGKDPRAIRGHHPDSWAWGRKWRNNQTGLVGPVIKHYPVFENQIDTKDRIVYLPIYEPGWEVQKKQKRGLREALAKVALVAEFDYMSYQNNRRLMMVELQKLMERIQPTIFLSQLHNGDVIHPDDIMQLRGMFSGTKFINWNGDVWPDNLLTPGGIQLAKTFDLQLIINRDVLDKYQELGVNGAYWQIGFEPDGVGHQPTEFHDVVFLANGYSKERQAFVKRFRSLGFNFGLYGNGWPGWAKGESTYNFIEACKVYRGAKISLGDSQWPETGFVSNRVFQALAAGGSALAHQWFRDMEQLGLVDGETCIIWRSFPELEEKIRYYLSHEQERQRIAQAGEQLALTRHSFDARVQELMSMLKVEQELIEEWRW